LCFRSVRFVAAEESTGLEPVKFGFEKAFAGPLPRRDSFDDDIAQRVETLPLRERFAESRRLVLFPDLDGRRAGRRRLLDRPG
jgi:hypothetical protein